MTRKHSNYKPRPVRYDNMAYVKQGFRTLPELSDENVITRAANHDALRSIAAGTGTAADVDVLINAFNMCEALVHVRANLGMDWKAEIRAGQNALEAMCNRGVATGRFLFTGPELTAINTAMEIHDAQLDETRVIEIEQAGNMIAKVLRTKKATRIGVAA
jgi:hypothetical protein